ncbi:hypothetical protein LMJF_26_2160 [Leishmania major strain Friedlin]|uniref:Flagellar attachment zone protein 1 conserved domain-containing protein n=1 Tax=Leishmania major TaxID=5664 RepID=Q4Q8X6_LEIMA|nr:hypothetical protein LMJF_26_2160 [Leishmania major strain Friedlin]CAG9576541.1 hypothetical_protein_-_conserved [Leishmania major strain Friedlin]CAJ05533.1 hypothetical protein LMJF_26_2160 [Leishmania major strain Friedlin]|eukprot:XP_001684222.1 hypothetical protein LMJF_26_2160 [Leishmania major strain Friedlin]
MFNTDAADAFYLRLGNTSCLDVSTKKYSPTSSRQGFLRHRGDSLGGPGDSHAYAINDAYHHTSHSSKMLALPFQSQSGSSRAYTRLEGAVEPRTPYEPVNSCPYPSTTTANPSSATTTGGALHLPAAHRRVGASLPVAGSGVWERADYLPRSCRVSSAAAPPASVVHSSDASRVTAATSTRFAGGGGGANLPPQRVRVLNRNGVNGARLYGSMGATTLSVARGVRAASGTGSTQRPSSAPSAMSAAASGRRDGAPSAAYTTNTYGSRGDEFGRLLAASASQSPLASAPRSQRATEHELRTSVPVAPSIHGLARYSSEDASVARRSAAASNGSGATSWTAGQRMRPYLPLSSSAMHKRTATAALEQDDGDYTKVSAVPAHSTRWSADPPSSMASVRSAPADASSPRGTGESALSAGSPKRLQSYKVSSTVAEQDPRSSEADAAEHDIDEGAATWWTVDIVINSAPCHGGSAYEEAAAMKAAALLRSPADMRTLRSVQCRAPVLPADASADEAWAMTQSLLRCIALASVGASSPPCAPQGYFCFNTDFNEYVQLSADTLPLASALFSVVMVASSVDTALAEERRAGYAEMSDATTDEAQTALVSTSYPALHDDYLLTGAAPSCNHDGAAPHHHWNDAAERGATAVTPRPPRGRRTSVLRHALRPSLQPHNWEGVTPSPLPPQPSAAAGSTSRHRPAFDGSTSSHHHLTPVEEVSPYPQCPRRSYESAVMSPGARGDGDSADVILTYDGDTGEDDSYPMISYSVESDAGGAVYGAASSRAPPTSCKGPAHGHYVDGDCAAGEAMNDAADSRCGNDAVGYIDDDGEAAPQAEAEEAIDANVVCTAKAAEHQLRASYGISSSSSSPEGTNHLRCFHNAPPSSKPLTQPLSNPSTTHGDPARLERDSKASPQRPPTAPTQGYSRVGVFAAMQRPSPSALPAAPLQPPQQHLFFDDPVLQRYFESACKQAPPSPQHAAGNAEGGSGGHYPIYVPSPPCAVPVPPSPPLPPPPPAHGAYRPGAHPYFNPSPSTASSVPGFAPTPPFSACGTETLTTTMNRVQRDALNVLLQRSAQTRQQAPSSRVPFRPPPTPSSSGDVAVSAAPLRATASTRPQAPRAAVDSAVDPAAAATGGIASTAHWLVTPSLSSLSRPLPLLVTGAAVPQAVAAPPPTSAEESTDAPMRQDRSPPPRKEELSAATAVGVDVPREVEADASVSAHAAAAAIAALPKSRADAVEATSQDDQHNREEAQRHHSTHTAPTLEGGGKDKAAAGMNADTDHGAERPTVVTTAAAAVEESRKSRGCGGDALGCLAGAETTPTPAAGSSAPAPAADESDAVAAGVEAPKESARTSPTDTDMELPASAVDAEEFGTLSASESAAAKEKNKNDCSHSQNHAAAPDAYPVEAGDPDTILTVIAVAARQAAYKVADHLPEQATLSPEAPYTAATARPAEYPTEAPRAQGDGDIAGGAKAPGESIRNCASAAEVVDIAAPDSTSDLGAHIAAAEAVGKTPASDSAAEPVDAGQPGRQQEEAGCTPEDDTPDTNVCVAQLEASTCADDVPLLLSEKQPSSVADDISMNAEGKREKGEEVDLACLAEPALEVSPEVHGDEHHAVVGEGSKAASPLQSDHNAELSATTDNDGNKALSEAGTSVTQQLKRTSDASDSPQALGSDSDDEMANAVAVDMLSSESVVAEKNPFGAATEAKALATQPDVAAAAAPVIVGGDSTPFLMIAAAKFLPAPVILVATQREKDEDPDAPPQVLHHRAAAAAAAAAANAFYGLWEESMTEDGTGDGDDAGGADHSDTTAVGGDEEEGGQQDRSATSEAVTTATITTSEDDIEGAVDVPMDVFRDSLSLTNTPTLIRRDEGRDENTSVAATASLADPIDMLTRTIGSDMRLPLASRAVTLVANPDAGIGSTDVHFHLRQEFPSAVASKATGGAAAAVGEIGVAAEAPRHHAGNEASVFSAEVAQRVQASSRAAHFVSPASASSPPSAASQPVASPNRSTVRTTVDANAGSDRLSSALREAEASPDAIDDGPRVEPHRSTATRVDGPVLPLFEVSGDVGGDGAATLKIPMPTAALEVGAADAPQPSPLLLRPFAPTSQTSKPAVPLPLSPAQVLSLPTPSLLPSPPLSEGAMRKTMVLLGFPGSAWEFIMTHHYEGMHDAFTKDSAVAANVPISAIQDVRYSKGSLMVDLYVLHPASSSENFIRDQMSSYAYPTLWAFYEVKKRERKQLLHSHRMGVAGAMPAKRLSPLLMPTLSSQEEVSWTAS